MNKNEARFNRLSRRHEAFGRLKGWNIIHIGRVMSPFTQILKMSKINDPTTWIDEAVEHLKELKNEEQGYEILHEEEF